MMNVPFNKPYMTARNSGTSSRPITSTETGNSSSAIPAGWQPAPSGQGPADSLLHRHPADVRHPDRLSWFRLTGQKFGDVKWA